MITIELSRIKAYLEEGEVKNLLSLFRCSENPDVERFLVSVAFDSEGRLTRTTLILDEDNNHALAGYFTVMIKIFEIQEHVSRSARQKIFGKRETHAFAGILIAQLGRSDSYKGILTGDMIMNFVLSVCEKIYDLTSSRIIWIEHDDVAFLNQFYEKHHFKRIQQNDNNKQLSYLKLE